MPLTITKLKMWKNPGYTRECVEVPPRGSWKMPAADYVASENLRPRKGSTLTAVELPLPYLQVMDMSYMYIEVEDGVTPTPNTVKLFGWIVSIEEIASSAEAVRITWTVDYWRSYSASAVFGAGMVTRCSDSTHRRPYAARPRMMLADTQYATDAAKYDFLMIITDMVSDDVTGFAYLFGQLDETYVTQRSPSVTELYSGEIDEILGYRPSQIVGCWIVPRGIIKNSFFKYVSNMTRSYTDPDNVTQNILFYRGEALLGNTKITNHGITTPTLTTDDMTEIVGVGPYGEIQSRLPWGMSIKGVFDVVVDISCNGISWYYFTAGADVNKAMIEGSYLKFDAVSVPITSNDWAEYTQSYQRSYDKRMREIQRNQQTVAGFTGITGSIVGGSIAGATSGGPAGAIAGAAAGASSSVIGTTIGYFTQGHFNDELQTETDKLISNQASTVLAYGGGTGWLSLEANISNYEWAWNITVLKADSVSAGEYSQHIANEGYTTEIPVTDATTYITTGGPLQIQNLILTGSIPTAAKTYIKNILSNGVRIVENNPSGVNP